MFILRKQDTMVHKYIADSINNLNAIHTQKIDGYNHIKFFDLISSSGFYLYFAKIFVSRHYQFTSGKW